MLDLTRREARLLRYALGFLESSLDESLLVEAAQEAAPETQTSGEPLPDVHRLIEVIRMKLKFAIAATDLPAGR
jgi:hypothetical protein